MKNATHVLRMSVMIVIGLTVAATARAADTDDRIEATAKKTYVFRTQLTNDSIHVASKDGAVVLTGTVSSESHKSLAEDTVKGLPGVQSVDNRLEVKATPPREMSDDWIGAKVKLALLFHRSVSGMTHVDVKDGVVTLRGPANSTAERDLATEYARDVDGVKSVNNEMTIAPTPPPGEKMSEQIDDASITAQIKFTLLNRRSTSALRTRVETKNGVVTLRGQAKNQAEIDLVTKLARDIEGVKSVNNEMTVEKSTS